MDAFRLTRFDTYHHEGLREVTVARKNARASNNVVRGVAGMERGESKRGGERKKEKVRDRERDREREGERERAMRGKAIKGS